MLREFISRNNQLFNVLRQFAKEQRGATATEYGILVAFLAFALVLGITAFGQALNAHYQSLALALSTALGTP